MAKLIEGRDWECEDVVEEEDKADYERPPETKTGNTDQSTAPTTSTNQTGLGSKIKNIKNSIKNSVGVAIAAGILLAGHFGGHYSGISDNKKNPGPIIKNLDIKDDYKKNPQPKDLESIIGNYINDDHLNKIKSFNIKDDKKYLEKIDESIKNLNIYDQKYQKNLKEIYKLIKN